MHRICERRYLGSRAMKHTTSRMALGLAVGVALAGGLAGPAQAKTWKAEATDPTGDGPVPGRDITDVKFRYKTNGSVLFVVTTAGPIDGTNADALVGVSLGTTCKKLILTGGGQFSAPDPVKFARVTGKTIHKPRKGSGEIQNNVYTLEVKHSSFKNWKPGCFAVALVDPNTPKDQAPVPFDQTGEIKIKG